MANEYLLCNVPTRYRDIGFEIRDGVKDHLDRGMSALRDGKCVTLVGGRGSGKTHMAVGLMREMGREMRAADPNGVENNMRVSGDRTYKFVFNRVADFYVDLKSNWSDGEGNRHQRTEREVIESYCDGEIIILDDLGIEKVSDWSRQLLYTLIDKLYGDCKRVIFTSNLSLKEISEKIDDRIASRLMEMGPVINIGNKDERREIAKQWTA